MEAMSVPKDFDPGLSHPFYFIRKGLLTAIKTNSPQLSGTMLDFGCGSKPYKSLIKVDKYIGLDFENPGHDHSKEQIDVYYDGKKIPFTDNYFDSILCSEVFEHIFNLDDTLRELNRVLKTGGKMLVTCPFVWGEHETPYDYARYTRFALTNMLEGSGFHVLSFEKQGNFIDTMAQMRALYFFSAFGPFFSKFSFAGNFFTRTVIFLINAWGKMKGKIFPTNNALYLSNIFLVEKINSPSGKE